MENGHEVHITIPGTFCTISTDIRLVRTTGHAGYVRCCERSSELIERIMPADVLPQNPLSTVRHEETPSTGCSRRLVERLRSRQGFEHRQCGVGGNQNAGRSTVF